MKYGAMNFPIKPVLDEIKDIGELGFDYLELAMDAPLGHYALIRNQKNEILKTLERYSMGLICHLPTFVYTADMTESIRKASLEEVLNSLEVAAELGASKVVLHPSIISGLGRFVIDTARKYAFEGLEKIIEKAEQKGISICLENMFPRYKLLVEPEEFAEVFERFPTLKLTLDTGHAHIDGKKGKRLLEFITMFGSNRMGHFHLSDNSGKRDEHLPIGKGNIDFKRVIKALKNAGYQDTATLEIFTENRNDLKINREKFAEMLASFGT